MSQRSNLIDRAIAMTGTRQEKHQMLKGTFRGQSALRARLPSLNARAPKTVETQMRGTGTSRQTAVDKRRAASFAQARRNQLFRIDVYKIQTHEPHAHKAFYRRWCRQNGRISARNVALANQLLEL